MNQLQTRKTFLYTEHLKLNAKIVNFHGFLLPVWYSSLKEEHSAVRTKAGIFDISHMGVLSVQGNQAFEFLQKLSCNDVTKALDHKMIYSMFLNEAGGILDDVTIGKLNDYFIVVVNASNKEKILTWMDIHKNGDVQINDLTKSHAFVALQGPDSEKILFNLFKIDLASKSRFSVFRESLMGVNCIILKTGYTGEIGCEIVIPKYFASKIWHKFIQNKVTPCGLAARDTLRIEAGLPLYGQELSEQITPLMTRYSSWIVKFDTDFIGKQALLEIKQSPQEYTTIGIELNDRIIPRTDYHILEGGKITSGTLSPSLDKPIAIALIKPEFSKLGAEVTVVIRDKNYTAKVVSLPFVKS